MKTASQIVDTLIAEDEVDVEGLNAEASGTAEPAPPEPKAPQDGAEQDEKTGEEDTEGESTAEIKITGSKEHVDAVCKLLAWVKYCGSVGHSACAKIFVDGDGAGQVDIEGLNCEAPTEDELNIGDKDAEFSICLD